MKDIINKFNGIVLNLLEQTSSLTGSSYLMKFNILIKINSAKPIDMFITHALPHKEYILSKNEHFFIMKSKESKLDFNQVIGITDIYYKLDEDSKNNIWDIIMALMYLAEERHKIKNNKILHTN